MANVTAITTTLMPCNVTGKDKNCDGFPDDYDQQGAMQYIVTTVLVYSLLGVCSMLCARIKRQHKETSNKDEELGRYLKMEKKVNLQAHRQKLMQHRKNMMKAILFRHEEKRMQRISESEEARLTESDLSGAESDTSLRSYYSETSETTSPLSPVPPYSFPGESTRKKSTATIKSVTFGSTTKI